MSQNPLQFPSTFHFNIRPRAFRMPRLHAITKSTSFSKAPSNNKATLHCNLYEKNMEDPGSMLCRVRVRVLTPSGSEEKPALLKPRDVPELTDQCRKTWVQDMQQFVMSSAEHQHIRPLDFQLYLSGTVEHRPISLTSLTSTTVYPPSYRIPPETIAELTTEEKVQRSERFALGSLIYEIYAGEAAFEGLSEHEIQDRFRRAHFPVVTHIPLWLVILSCWSLEFAIALQAMPGRRSLHQRPFSALKTSASNVFSFSSSPPSLGAKCLKN